MSSMLFWTLVAIVGFGVRQLVLHLPIPPELVRRHREEEATRLQASLTGPGTVGAGTDHDWQRRRYDDYDDDDGDFFSDPGFNIDGTPMVGDLDANGNPFGITDDW